MENEVLKIARRIQAISQSGLRYAENEFDLQRYEELRELSIQLASEVSYASIEKIRDIFTCETGFQTPKVDVRAVVIKEGKILLGREKADNRWSIPGGFADINYSPTKVAEKEVFEETGLHVKANRLLAVVDTDKHNFPPLEYHYYKLVILCDYIGGELRGSNETYESAFFSFENLPDLSIQRNTKELFALIEQLLGKSETYTD